MAEEKEKEALPTEATEKASEEETKEVEVPKNLAKIVEEIENLKVIDLAELVKVLEKKFGVSAMPMVSAMAAGPAAGAAPAAGEESKQFFSVNLTAIGEKKIEVIKVIRDITQKGLKEAKDLVDGVESGAQVVLEKVKAEEAEEIKKKLEQAGASVELK